MLVLRAVLSAGLVLIGALVVVRMLGMGLHREIVPGVVLGAAMIGLGAHRLSLIVRMRGTRT